MSLVKKKKLPCEEKQKIYTYRVKLIDKYFLTLKNWCLFTYKGFGPINIAMENSILQNEDIATINNIQQISGVIIQTVHQTQTVFKETTRPDDIEQDIVETKQT